MTIDPFMLLAPVLLLAVIALLRFVGCDRVLGLEPIQPIPTDTPMISGFDPADATVGDGVSTPFELTVNGSNFVTGLTVTFDSTPVSVTSVAPTQTQIKATVPGNLLDTARDVTVTVTNPDAQTASATYRVCRRVAVTFAVLPPGPVTGIIPLVDNNIDFGTNQWNAEGAVPPQDPNAHIYFASGAGPGSFSFPALNPKLLKSMKVSWVSTNVGSGTVTVIDNNNQNGPPNSLSDTSGQQTINFDWKIPSMTVTVAFPVINTLGIDQIDYQDCS